MKRLLITGASGLLGLNLALSAAEWGYNVTGWTHSRTLRGVPFSTDVVDLTDLDQLRSRIERVRPNAVINCAVAAVDESEQDPKRAELLNGLMPGVLAESAKALGCQFVQISTDAVFDGYKGDYRETDAVHPLYTYAQTKLLGELSVQSAFPEALIARVVFYGWSASGKRSLAEFFYNNLIAERVVMGFTDMVFTPLYTKHLSDLLLRMVEHRLDGMYHVYGGQALSKYTFGVALAQEFGLDETLISPVSFEDSGMQPQKPLNLSMNTEKLVTALGEEMPGINAGLHALRADLENGYRARLLSVLA